MILLYKYPAEQKTLYPIEFDFQTFKRWPFKRWHNYEILLKKLKMFGVRGVNQAWFRRYFSPWKELKEGKFHFLFKSFHLHTALKRLSFASVFYVCLLVKKHAKLEKFKYSIQIFNSNTDIQYRYSIQIFNMINSLN